MVGIWCGCRVSFGWLILGFGIFGFLFVLFAAYVGCFGLDLGWVCSDLRLDFLCVGIISFLWVVFGFLDVGVTGCLCAIGFCVVRLLWVLLW